MTALDLITKSFVSARITGSGEPLTVADSTDAFDLLNGIIEQANIDKLFGLYETEIVFALQSNKISYTIGPASSSPDVTAVRPVEVLNAFTRRTNIDIPMGVTHQKEDYDRIRMKSIGIAGWESMLYYQATFPAGTAFFYMQPVDSLSTVHLTVKANIAAFVALTDTVSLPPGYRTWLQYKLAQRLTMDYGHIWSDMMQAILIDAESSLKSNNIKPMPQMQSGLSALGRSGNGGYNPYSDQTRGV